MKVSFCTLGCKVNQAETNKIKEQFLDLGYEIVDYDQAADVAVINTCSVTHVAERKSRNLIRKAYQLNNNVKIYVCGCYANIDNERLKSEVPEIFKIISSKDKEVVLNWGIEDLKIVKSVKRVLRAREFIKIQDGCDQFCAYCVIPYARQKLSSKRLEEITNEAKELVNNGAKEIVLTGINIGKYQDRNNNLINVLNELEKIEDLFRIRISSIEPNFLDDRLIEKIGQSNKIAKHLHISLQSGSNTILKLMKRPYFAEDYRELISKVRKVMPDIALTTDLIVGFPGENETTIKESVDFIEDLKFADLHVFRFSPRPKTAAADMKQALNYEEIGRFVVRAESVKRKLKEAYVKKFINKEVEVLIEQNKASYALGHSDQYQMVKIENKDLSPGDVIKIVPRKIAKDLTLF